MGKINVRDKGQRGEREVIALLQPVVNRTYEAAGLEPPLLQRNQMQSHKGGYDIVGLDWLALEVKFQESFNVERWWVQCNQQCKEGQLPVLFYRKSRVAWRVRTYGYLDAEQLLVRGVVDISLETFLFFVEKKIERILQKAVELNT